MTKVFFTGCPHFEHENIIKLANRPFANADEMNATLVRNWNEVVSNDDIVYLMGDVTWGRGIHWLKQLNGAIAILPGNHDDDADLHTWRREGYTILPPLVDIQWQGQWFNLCHYPIEDWNRRYKGSIHLHCHTHSLNFRNPSLPYIRDSALAGHANDSIYPLPIKYPAEIKCNRFNIGMDATKFYPMQLETILDAARTE